VLRIEHIGDIIFDLIDSDIAFNNLHDSCVFYFKRSYCPISHANFKKICPLGLNYEARSKQISFNAIIRATRLSRSPTALARSLCRAFHLPKPEIFDPTARTQAPLTFAEIPRVLFIARSWDPVGSAKSEREVREINAINEMRADCVRKLRAAFGDRFTGGMIRGAHANKHFPDCLTPADLPTDRAFFLRFVDEHQIFVATAGLHNSTGWKFDEFPANGRAFVTENMRFSAPGPLQAGVNYMAFETSDECIAQCHYLVPDPHASRAMMIAIRTYFFGYAAPASIVRNALYIVAQEIQYRPSHTLQARQRL
jgi:hypothetical protein